MTDSLIPNKEEDALTQRDPTERQTKGKYIGLIEER